MGRRHGALVPWVLALVATGAGAYAAEAGRQADRLEVRTVNRLVSDYPAEPDFSTPESAYAAVNRILASGAQGKWRDASAARLRDRLPEKTAPSSTVNPAEASHWLGSRILEIRIFRGVYAVVLAERGIGPNETLIDKRVFELEDGRWLNAGHDTMEDIDAARRKFGAQCSRMSGDLRAKRTPSADPEADLAPFVDYLRKHGQDPQEFVLDALSRHRVTLMGEVHHRPIYWDFNCSLVRDPRFVERVGAVYLELPLNDQDRVDRFLASADGDPEPVIDVLRDVFWMGWPDQAMLDFFQTVWAVNAELPAERRICIVLVDMQRPWSEIHKREDWRPYNVDRDRYMADNVLEDLKKNADDTRNAFFIVGMAHAMVDFTYAEGSPVPSAGRYLAEALGDENVYSIHQHCPVMTNMGQVDGRLCLGLFDAAFNATGRRAVGFSLSEGPFGAQPYDGMPDLYAFSTFSDGYDAYLYLGPLEHETFSPLIAGFYTKRSAIEADRRHRIMNGQGFFTDGIADEEKLIEWMSNSWGKPRAWRNQLGPVDAWELGSEWKAVVRKNEHNKLLDEPEKAAAIARRLFEAIRDANYSREWASEGEWQHFLPNDCDYAVERDYPGWVAWVCATLRNNPIQAVEVGNLVSAKPAGRSVQGLILPAIEYSLVLKDGKRLEGVLPFEFDPLSQQWRGIEGLDWHLQEDPFTKP